MGAAVWMLLASCAAPVPEPSPEQGVRVRMDFTRPGGVYDAPFPSDDLLRAGRVDLSAYPAPDDNPYVGAVLGSLAGATGFATTGGVFLALDGPLELAPIAAADTLGPDAAIWLAPVDDLDARVPLDVLLQHDPGPFGAPWLLSALPVQGAPLRPGIPHVLVVTADLHPDLVQSDAVATIIGGGAPPGLEPGALASYRAALSAVIAAGVPADNIAAATVFTPADPVTAFRRAVHAARGATPEAPSLVLTEAFDGFCVFEGRVQMPVYQEGAAPYEVEGGGWVTDDDGVLVQQRLAESRLWLTLPRTPTPPGGFPVAAMIRTGGGGDNPLVHRGVRDENGDVIEPGTGPAAEFARAGWVGVSVDGPHGGPRNVTGGDEQFLMFSIINPLATRDNVRQSALEIALLPDIVRWIAVDGSECAGADPLPTLDVETMALMGHSMGATIAPLVLTAEARYRGLILSGAGGSYVHNLVYKQSPIPVRPLAESILGYVGRELHPHDPFLSVLQWAAEPADPPPYLAALVREGSAPHTLMVQGIVDTYILPPMANATSLSAGLDLGGAALDETHPDLGDFEPISALLPLVGGAAVTLPASGNRAGRTAIVVQHAQDPVEDGHEVVFQSELPKAQVRCFLETLADGRAPVVPAAEGACD